MEISDDALETEFSTMGHTLGGDSEILDKIKEICQLHRLDATTISEHWVAFTHSKNRIKKISVENLELMERELSKNKSTKTSNKLSSNTVYDVNSLQQVVDNDTDDLLGAYNTPNNKNAKKRQHTPDTVQNKRLTGLSRSPAAPFSPTSMSPAPTTPNQNYSARKNSGEVITTFGTTANVKWRSTRNIPCKVKEYDPSTQLTDKFKYMFQKMADKAHVLNDLIEDMGDCLKEHHKTGDFSHVALPAQEMVTVCGRVCCDSVGKLNAHSVVLEGSRETSAGKQIAVDLSGVPTYSLFSGQIVAVDGTNTTGNKLFAKKFYDGVSLPPADLNITEQSGPLSVVVATGPFTTQDDFNYEPLEDLITYLNRSPPDVCFLLGPFIDSKGSQIESLCNQTYDELFKSCLENVLNRTARNNTQFIIVPSQRDIHCEYVYPQPPCKVKLDPAHSGRVRFVSDPSTLTLDGIVFGLTSTDILFHLGNDEISWNAPTTIDRLSRLTKHLLTQHSYYPLYPPIEDQVNIDYEIFEQHARIPVKPHILILPSDLRHFIKDVDGCCCVNAGRLAKGLGGGMFCRMVISAPKDNSTTFSMSQVAAELVKI